MSLIRTVAITVLAISSVVFVALFGRLPIFRKTPIGFLHRLIWVHVPNGFMYLDQRLTGRRITSSLRRFFNYIMNEPHPLVMIFFIILQAGGEILFIPPSLSHLSPWPHYFLMSILVSAPYITLYFCYTTNSTITPHNHVSALQAYPYDYILYHPNQTCRTCQHSKPARSKHCSICKVCVERQDHHCIWINNCVGRNNYLYFNLLLWSIALLMLYGGVTGYKIINRILQNTFVPPELIRGSGSAKYWATKLTWWEYLDAWLYGISLSPGIGAVTLLCIMCCPLATGFLVYHIYLVWAGMTTNESSKWADLREDIYDDIVFQARTKEIKPDYPGSLDEGTNPGLRGWGKRADWWIIRTRGGQQPTRRVFGGRPGDEEPDDRWRRVRSLQDVENVYDLGFVENLKDLMFNKDR